MASPVSVVFRNPMGVELATLRDYTRLEYARKECEFGVMDLTLPADDLDKDMLMLDARLEPWVRVGSKKFLDGESVFFLRDWKYQNAGGERTWQLKAFDANYLYDGAIVAYNSGNAYTEKVDYADDLIKAIARENLGALATDTTRNLSAWFTIAADLGLAAQSHKAFSRRQLLTVFQELAEESRQRGTYLTFDTVYTSPTQLTLKTYTGSRGVDHSADSGDPVKISEDSGTLVDPELDEDHAEEHNYIYAGGQGVGAARAIATASDAERMGASPFNRREFFVDGRNAPTDDADYLASEAQAALRAARAKKVLTGKIVDTEGLVYGIHYGFGDILSATCQGVTFDAHLDTIHVTVEGGVITRDNRIRGES